MPKMRFMGSEAVYVSPLGRTVGPDEQVEIDDDLVWSAPTVDDDGNVTDPGNERGYVWPEELWAEVGSGRRRTVPVNKDAENAKTDNSTDNASKEG